MLTSNDEEYMHLCYKLEVVDNRCITKHLIAENMKSNNEYALKWFRHSMVSFEQWKIEEIERNNLKRQALEAEVIRLTKDPIICDSLMEQMRKEVLKSNL